MLFAEPGQPLRLVVEHHQLRVLALAQQAGVGERMAAGQACDGNAHAGTIAGR
jgi:hypothetical protein